MKIYILPVDKMFQPDRTNYISPVHNADWNIERDCHQWLLKNPQFCTDNPQNADYHYLPFYFNSLYINGHWGEDWHEEMQDEILRLVNRNQPTFTVVEYDIVQMQPFFDLCNMTVFCGSRQGEATIDVPLLCSPHEPRRLPEKHWTASFVGNVMRDGLRQEMAEFLAGRNDVLIEHADRGEDYFVDTMLASYIALSPRGHGGQTMRFYEAMQLGVVPMLIGQPDTRPFKDWIPWEMCSLYAPTIEDIDLSQDKDLLDSMGQYAQVIYYQDLRYGQWEKYLLKELERRL